MSVIYPVAFSTPYDILVGRNLISARESESLKIRMVVSKNLLGLSKIDGHLERDVILKIDNFFQKELDGVGNFIRSEIIYLHKVANML